MLGWGEDEEESKDGEGESCVREGGRYRLRMRVGLRWCMFGWCWMCIFGVGGEDGDGDECGGKDE